MTMTDSTTQDFAKAVRAELADLSHDEIADLTDGLEADLAERFAEEGNELGSPAIYAAELRAAAGIAPKPQNSKLHFSKKFGDEIVKFARSNRAAGAFYEFTVSLRPIWWFIRAWLAWVIAVSIIDGWSPSHLTPSNGTQMLILPLLIFASVQWGRKKWFKGKFFVRILAPLNILAALLIPVGLSAINSAIDDVTAMENALMTGPDVSGLRLDGVALTGITAKDATGKAVDGLAFYTPEGKQLLTSGTIKLLVPDVTGMRLADAMKVMQDAGFTSGGDITYLDGATELNSVIDSTSPAAGDSADSSTIINFVVKRN